MSGRLGRYEILKTIASGGMATVLLGRVVGAGGFERLVAIKSMHPHIAADPDFVDMFLDEARLAARVRHPNVVPTIDVHEKPLFLVMEFVEGPSLHAALRALGKQGGRLPVPIALRILLDVLAGLHAAHELADADGTPLAIVHRDVSPQNMLIGVDGVSRITDFGVARAESRLSTTRGGQVKGKIAYMAPEQVRSEPVDRRVDVYAAGVCLWEMLAGHPLFVADNEAALVAQVSLGANRSPREVEPSVPAPLDAVCMQALRLDREERPASAAELAEALEVAALEAGVTIATPRAVAAYVKELAVHHRPDSMAPPPPGALAELAALAPPTSSSPDLVGRSSASDAAVLTNPDAPAPRAAWKVPAAAVVAGTVVAIGLFLALGRPGAQTPRVPGSPSSAAGPATGAAADPGPSAGPSAAGPSAAGPSAAGPSAEPSAAGPSAEPSAAGPSEGPAAGPPDGSAEPAPSASAAATSSAPAPAYRPPSPRPPPQPTSFRPSGL